MTLNVKVIKVNKSAKLAFKVIWLWLIAPLSIEFTDMDMLDQELKNWYRMYSVKIN